MEAPNVSSSLCLLPATDNPRHKSTSQHRQQTAPPINSAANQQLVRCTRPPFLLCAAAQTTQAAALQPI